MLKDGVTIYYGAASGQQRSALRRLDPEAIMISYATVNNQPWDGDYKLFVDSGGYHHMMSGDGKYGSSDEAYLDYLAEHQPHRYALRDYPCEPDLLDSLFRTVAEQQERTLNHHIELLDKIEDSSVSRDNAVTVVQGWTTDQYLAAFDDLRDHDCLTDTIAIGSICRRGADHEIADIILELRDAIPDRIGLHAFGVKGNVLRFKSVADALESVDSQAYDYSASRYDQSNEAVASHTWRDSARCYLQWRHNLLGVVATETLTGGITPRQQSARDVNW